MGGGVVKKKIKPPKSIKENEPVKLTTLSDALRLALERKIGTAKPEPKGDK